MKPQTIKYLAKEAFILDFKIKEIRFIRSKKTSQIQSETATEVPLTQILCSYNSTYFLTC